MSEAESEHRGLKKNGKTMKIRLCVFERNYTNDIIFCLFLIAQSKALLSTCCLWQCSQKRRYKSVLFLLLLFF